MTFIISIVIIKSECII